jgi:hypothetical protein
MSKPDLKMDMEKDLVYPVSGTREDWEARSDVIYHMYAYQFFSYMSGKKTGIGKSRLLQSIRRSLSLSYLVGR